MSTLDVVKAMLALALWTGIGLGFLGGYFIAKGSNK